MRFALSVFLTLFIAATLPAIDAGPRENHGEQITVDLPNELHLMNKGGSDRAGLCVFTSIDHAARYQSCEALIGFRDFMTQYPGGGWPEKVAQYLPRMAASKGLPVPDYVQHTGGDVEFLKLALRTGRYVCVTYSGSDGVFYRGPIAHMVNLVHLSDQWAVIHDNNSEALGFKNQYLWMTPAQFEQRWKSNGGGWAIALLAPPPPPIPTNARPQNALAREDEMKDFALMLTLLAAPQVAGQCPNGQCSPGNYSTISNSSQNGRFSLVHGHFSQPCPGGICTVGTQGERWIKIDGDDRRYLFRGDVQIGCRSDADGYFWPFDAATRTWGAKVYDLAPAPKGEKIPVKPTPLPRSTGATSGDVKAPKCICPPEDCQCKDCPSGCIAFVAGDGPEPMDGEPFPGGVNKDKVPQVVSYDCSGKKCTRQQAFQSLVGASGLTDDRNKSFLTIVGDDQLRRAVLRDLDKSDALRGWRDRLHIAAYPPDHWCVRQVGLAGGITLQGPPDVSGTSPVIWRFRAYAGDVALAEALRKSDPNYRSDSDPDPTKKPEPPKQPDPSKPTDPVKPDSSPTTPMISWQLILGVIAIIAAFIFGKKSK